MPGGRSRAVKPFQRVLRQIVPAFPLALVALLEAADMQELPRPCHSDIEQVQLFALFAVHLLLGKCAAESVALIGGARDEDMLWPLGLWWPVDQPLWRAQLRHPPGIDQEDGRCLQTLG